MNIDIDGKDRKLCTINDGKIKGNDTFESGTVFTWLSMMIKHGCFIFLKK